MTFRDLQLKEIYDSDEDKILEDFYIPVLSEATKYDRLAGFFSSATLASSSKGMAKFIQNGSKMRLVTCIQLSENDKQAIMDGMTNPDDVLAKIMLTEFNAAEELEKNHVGALAWLVAMGKLEIKLAVPYRQEDGFVTDELDKNSIYHQKIGILHDSNHDVISFSGSVNETRQAWMGNVEEFKVFSSWKDGQNEFGAADARKFEKFWYGNSKNTKIYNLPEAVKENLIKNAPKTMTDAISSITSTLKPQPKLRDYQHDAINKWFENNMHGIFEMATGTGKTWTAIACIKKLLDKSEPMVVVIACPYKHLITQWQDELDKWNIDSKSAYNSSKIWRREIGNDIMHLNTDVLQKLVIVTTHDTFSGEKFIEMMKTCSKKSFVICDEVHKIGAEQRSESLLDSYDYRLGLSATPKRYFDDDGTKKILDFFGSVVYEFGLDEAIKSGYLTSYSLFPHIIYMTSDEFDKYHSYSKSIAIEKNQDHPDLEKIKRLLFSRANIVKTADNKLNEFEKILQESDKIDHCLVYCAKMEQLKKAGTILHKKGITYHRFTDMEKTTKERKKLLDEFDTTDKQVLLAIKCLDEGVDVPSTNTAIILASSNNPIEFIQRRGRILRTYPGKKHAIIHDMIVLPSMLSEDEDYVEYEKNIIRKEFERIKEFAYSSKNPEYTANLLQPFIKRYNL